MHFIIIFIIAFIVVVVALLYLLLHRFFLPFLHKHNDFFVCLFVYRYILIMLQQNIQTRARGKTKHKKRRIIITFKMLNMPFYMKTRNQV